MARPKKPVEHKKSAKTLKDLHISVTDFGVYVPRYGHMEDGQLYMKGRRKYKDLNTAIRGETHTLESIEGYAPKHEEDHRAADRVHQQFRRWSGLTEAEKRKALQLLESVSFQLEGNRAISPADPLFKREAFETLDEALADNNASRISARLVRVKSKLKARAKGSRREQGLVQRRRELMIEEKRVRDKSALDTLRQTMILHRKVKEGRATVGELRKLADELSRMPEASRRKTTHKHVQEALESLKKGERSASTRSLRDANKSMAKFVSRFVPLPKKLSEQIAQSGDKRFKTVVARRQLRLAKENLEYWHSSYSHEPMGPEDIRTLISSAGELVSETNMSNAAERANSLLAKNKVTEAKAALEEVIPKSKKKR